MASATKPLLRWAGAKTQILDRLASYYSDPSATYIEPFCGSASLYLRIAPNKAILGDLNKDLIDAYRTIRQRPDSVYKELSQWPREETAYYRIRALKPATLSHTVRAARFVYLNRLCFNGLYRTNLAGDFNVPWGADRSGQLPNLDQFRGFALRLRNAWLVNRDFESTIALARKGSFVYLDPPYRVSKKRVFREYMPSGFGAEDVTRIRSAIIDLDSRGAKFILSYAESEEAKLLSEGFISTAIPVKRFIAGATSSRGCAQEILITNIAGENNE